jgi:hypothetical protein
MIPLLIKLTLLNPTHTKLSQSGLSVISYAVL